MLYLIKLNITLIACYLLYKGVFQHGTTLQARRIFLLFSLVFSLIIPFAATIHFSDNIAAVTTVLSTVNIQSNTLVKNVSATGNYSQYVTGAYIGIAIIMFLSAVFKVWSLFRIIRQSAIEKNGQYKLISNSAISAPASFFNYIFMPENLDAKSYSLILIHERLHVKQWHSVDVLFTEILKWVCWFNPVAYLFQKEIRFVHECIADKAAGETQQVTYQQLLVQFHLSASVNTLTNHFNQTTNLKRRITMFNQQFSITNNAIKLALVLPFFVCIGILQSGAQTSEKSKTTTEEGVTNPEFPGGINELMSYLASNIVYPEAAKAANIQGTSIIEFTVAKNGKVKDVHVKKSANPELDAEAVRVVSSMPNWKPGEKEGKKTDVVQILPIRFALN